MEGPADVSVETHAWTFTCPGWGGGVGSDMAPLLPCHTAPPVSECLPGWACGPGTPFPGPFHRVPQRPWDSQNQKRGGHTAPIRDSLLNFCKRPLRGEGDTTHLGGLQDGRGSQKQV